MTYKPSYDELRWAKKQEYESKKNLKKRYSQKKLNANSQAITSCPVDDALLMKHEIDNTGISVNKCPICKGIWIDRKNMEKLFQSANASEKLLKVISKSLGIHLSKIED